MEDLEEFSGGYFAADMVLAPYADGPAIQQDLHDYLRREVYRGTDAPVLFRLDISGSPYFQVSSEYSIPSDTLALPEEWFEDYDLDDNRRARPIFILKPRFSHLITESHKLGEVPPDVTSGDDIEDMTG